MTQSSENGSRVRFSGFVFDADACTLMRDTGEAIPLTHGEFALLRFLLAHPGRVMSRDRLLSAIGSRRLEPFDRSVDVLMGRLRRKIESDPKRPCLIVTVPGEGYRFDGLVAATAAVPTANGYGANPALEPPEGLPTPIRETPSMQNQSVRWVRPYVLAVCALRWFWRWTSPGVIGLGLGPTTRRAWSCCRSAISLVTRPRITWDVRSRPRCQPFLAPTRPCELSRRRIPPAT